MQAKSIKGATPELVSQHLTDSMADGFTPTIAVVFNYSTIDYIPVCQLLEPVGITIFGASSSGEFIDGTFDEPATAILLLDINPAFFRVVFIETGQHSTREIAQQVGEIGLQTFRKPAFIVASAGLGTDGDLIIEGIEAVSGKGVSIFGGLASADDLRSHETYVFTNGKICYNGLIALIVDSEKISFNGLSVVGWKPVGMMRTITKSEGNVVYTIDNEPALDFFYRYNGMKISKSVGAILQSDYFQLHLYRDGKHPVMRTPMIINPEDGSIVFAGSLPQGSKVRLTMLPGFDVIENVVTDFTNFKEKLSHQQALIMFSCKGRSLALGPAIGDEIQRIKDVWDVPMAGFLCYGELGKVNGNINEFHNMSCSVVLLSELD